MKLRKWVENEFGFSRPSGSEVQKAFQALSEGGDFIFPDRVAFPETTQWFHDLCDSDVDPTGKLNGAGDNAISLAGFGSLWNKIPSQTDGYQNDISHWGESLMEFTDKCPSAIPPKPTTPEEELAADAFRVALEFNKESGEELSANTKAGLLIARYDVDGDGHFDLEEMINFANLNPSSSMSQNALRQISNGEFDDFCSRLSKKPGHFLPSWLWGGKRYKKEEGFYEPGYQRPEWRQDDQDEMEADFACLASKSGFAEYDEQARKISRKGRKKKK